MSHYSRILILAGSLALAGAAPASDDVEHYEGKPAETLEQAVANFSEYNAKLAAVLEQKELTPQDLATVHQLTYTLENALERINHDFSALAETLEAIHLASERADAEGVGSNGARYLDTARKVVP
ncbi:MAG: DUF6746 family protein [Gammaproteobacteria bacterium]|nr:DUF6746 family protein [Gammaproteobacteria bacterium]